MKTIIALIQAIAGLFFVIYGMGKDSLLGVGYIIIGTIFITIGVATTHSKESKREVNNYHRNQRRLEAQKRRGGQANIKTPDPSPKASGSLLDKFLSNLKTNRPLRLVAAALVYGFTSYIFIYIPLYK